MNKKQFVQQLETIGAVFDTEMRIWRITGRELKQFNTLTKNLQKEKSKKDKNFIRVICDDGLVVHILLTKEYRKVGEYKVIMRKGDKVYFNTVDNNKELKSFVSAVKKHISMLSVYDSNGVAVSKSLWV